MSESPPPTASPPPVSSQKVPRTWPQRLTIGAAFVLAFASFGAAGGLYAGQRVIEDRNIAPAIVDPSQSAAAGLRPPADTDGDTEPAAPVGDDTDVETAPESTFPPVAAESEAKNFLITGADNNSCVDPGSPYAPAFGDRSGLGERSDTIMMWRVNPSNSQVAVLSFPRDLWVTIPGRSSQQRINVAYERDNPQRLIDTIYQNFGIVTDHFIQVDFCAFKTLVDAVDGVAVPFESPVRDTATGLDVAQPGCFTFDGDHALAYVRSRKLQTFSEQRGWTTDGTSDLGRISRQQDFLRRTVSRLLAKGALDPNVAGGLIETYSRYVVTDPELTPRKMIEFAGVMSRVDPTQITTYQIEATNKNIQGNAVLIPQLGGRNMQAILSVFRGDATLAEAPEQVFETTVPPTAALPSGGTATTVAPPPTVTLPTVEADENIFGVVPDAAITC
jgi:LCP family protein required for cell wall assembly